jgi:sRNA-binding regulator protein Hfq
MRVISAESYFFLQGGKKERKKRLLMVTRDTQKNVFKHALFTVFYDQKSEGDTCVLSVDH